MVQYKLRFKFDGFHVDVEHYCRVGSDAFVVKDCIEAYDGYYQEDPGRVVYNLRAAWGVNVTEVPRG